ncbi:hypothetical protein F443_13701 [Phytophthora nicotianae P1569]|uniref:Uncharacterized protein n=1 Tax=Phytophthora nicotianae P1569 TaxID=1317065 RepID=V9ERA7_PHYNI|nr:hypothetical protein F443_13701 [Phytophthora nicotianae P1569]
MFALRPDKIPSAAVDTEDLSEDDIDTLSDAQYDREMHRIRRAQMEKAKGEAGFASLPEKLRKCRKRVEKYLASVALYEADFKERQETALAARDEEFAKVEKLITDLKVKGPARRPKGSRRLRD